MATGAEILRERYETDDPREVGAVDGTEDDFGDLLVDAVQTVGRDFDSLTDAELGTVHDVAVEATTMDDLLDRILAALS